MPALRVDARRRRFLNLARVVGLLFSLTAWSSPALSEEAQWIWAPRTAKDPNPQMVYLRKTFDIGRPDGGAVEITADEQYELLVNGRKVGEGKNWKMLNAYDISPFLTPGRNVIAIKASKTSPGRAGAVARVAVKQAGNTYVSYSTDGSWRASVRELPNWARTKVDSPDWVPAETLGMLGHAAPWGSQVIPGGAVAGTARSGRFTVMREFQVEQILGASATGSLIAMTFDEYGRIIASREGSGLILVSDTNRDGKLDKAELWCDLVKNCQGILALGSNVLAVGEGPEGTALYRLLDNDGDGRPEAARAILKFSGAMGEHGPHAPVLGPDGLIYVIVGNHTRIDRPFDPTSPHHDFYEGDLLQPKYEDAGGHAVGIKAPGGVVVRTDLDGSFLELVSGGFRNAYDMAFNREGELFTYDSDMEWDLGLPWYRPTRLLHVTSGSEFGWRSGWSKWPSYYLDNLPPVSDTGPGSPTGVACYNHVMYPKRFHNSLFLCDWARGRILNVRLSRAGGSYTATSEVFVEGRPLNVVDLEVGPDGALYFITGGRGTEGGIYRVVWQGRVPPEVVRLGTGITAVLKQYQPNSAWGQRSVAAARRQLGANWDRLVAEAAANLQVQPELRLQALTLMQLFGPFPDSALLVKVSGDSRPELRAKAAYLLGIHCDDQAAARLVELLADADAGVRRQACEALERAGRAVPPEHLLPLLADRDRYVAWAARRALERLPIDGWRQQVLESENLGIFLGGSVALLTVAGNRENALAVLERSRQVLSHQVSDPDFLNLLRVMQLALHRGQIAPADVAQLAAELGHEYPVQAPPAARDGARYDYLINRELVRLLAYLQQGQVLPRVLDQIHADVPLADKIHAALCARYFQTGWQPGQKLELLKFYEYARALPGGHSFSGYLDNVSRDFVAGFTAQECEEVLAMGSSLPTAALFVLAAGKIEPGPDVIARLIELDRLAPSERDEAAKRLSIGIVAVLAQSGSPDAMAYLRELFQRDPERRDVLAIGLAQQPDGENWQVLVDALGGLGDEAVQEVMTRLAAVDRRPANPEPIRQVILRGLKQGEKAAPSVVALLERWSGQRLAQPSEPWDKHIARWQEWFVAIYPDAPEPRLLVESTENRWQLEELLTYLESPEAAEADASRGQLVFEKAQCAKCHRFGPRGEGIGPDLTTISQRFQKKEIIEAVLHPSQVISDQYVAKNLVLADGRIVMGIVAPAGAGKLAVLQQSGEKLIVDESEIEEQHLSKTSAMPEGLFNSLTQEEIADLIAYLGSSAPKSADATEPLLR